jgi:hypothetical protein
LRIYARTLKVDDTFTPLSTTSFDSNESVELWHTRQTAFSGTFRQGNRSNFEEGGFGDYALIQYYNTTFTEADFDQLFFELIHPVPEPGTGMLLVFGLLAFRSVRSRRR